MIEAPRRPPPRLDPLSGKMAEDPSDDTVLEDDADDMHLSTTVGTNQGVHFVDSFDKPCPGPSPSSSFGIGETVILPNSGTCRCQRFLFPFLSTATRNAGLDLDMVVTPNECDTAPFTEDVHVSVTSDSEAVITVYGSDLTIPITGYTVAGGIGYIETSLPDWQVTDTWLTMIWSSSTQGRFTGGAKDYDGSPITFSGTFSVVAR